MNKTQTQNSLAQAAEKLVVAAKYCSMTISLAESCTGGMASSAIVDIPGSSAVLERAFIVYSNIAKIEMLGVKSETLDKYGAVSEEVAKAMALGALKNSNTNAAAAITGIAGPGGGTEQKPVGLVYIAVAIEIPKKKFLCVENIFAGNRSEIRQAASITALTEMYKMIKKYACD